jgi:hypothetical protein
MAGKPAWTAKTEQVTFDFIIEKWAANTNAPKRGKQDKTTKANRFAAWLGHNDMAKVTFEECRDYRDSLLTEAREGRLSYTSAKQHMKHLKALFAVACYDGHCSVKISRNQSSFLPSRASRSFVAAGGMDPLIHLGIGLFGQSANSRSN